VLGKESVRY
jgi:hypothetical protein